MKRKQYSTDFKNQVVREVQETGSAAQVTRRHDLAAKLVYRWVAEWKKAEPQEIGREERNTRSHKPLLEELQALEQENLLLKKLVGERELQLELLRNQLNHSTISTPRKKRTVL